MSRNNRNRRGASKDSGSNRQGNRPKVKKNAQQIVKRGKEQYQEKKKFAELVGKVSMIKDGAAFIVIPDQQDDIFVPSSQMRKALDGDIVKVVVRRRRTLTRAAEGEVVDIIERCKNPHVGILQISGGNAWVIIESRSMPFDIRIPEDSLKAAEAKFTDPRPANGLKVAALVTEWPRNSEMPLGVITDVLGLPGENNTEMHAILAEYTLPYRFEPEVEAAAAKIPVKITDAEVKNRRDFRDAPTFTIDPADAKDFDDALSVRRLKNGNWEIGVHIADVSHYVKPDSMLDHEAYERATSVYLVDRTIPMLPEVLSNNLCSLRPNEEKLTFSAVFELDDNAKVLGKWFGRTIISSDQRFNYDQAQAIIEGGDGPMKNEILAAWHLAEILRKRRFENGAILFDRPEMKVEVDENGKPINVYEKVSKEANFLVEEFMLLANRSVAEFVALKCGIKNPTMVYRIHEDPNPDKLETLRTFSKTFGYRMGEIGNRKQTSETLNALMEQAKGKPEEDALQMIALRSMARARYSTDNVGHYGLAFQYYTHFTSPIRRYPDMMVHRLLALYLDHAPSQNKDFYEERCKWSSEKEQIATQAERDSVKYKEVEFMQDKVGQIYDGFVSGVTATGMFVEIEPTKIEGMIPLRDIKSDYFIYDEKKFKLTGKSTHKVFTLGTPVRVRVAKTNLEQKILDYQLVEEERQK
jgi:ribonuclease R